jgi:hypothetical protein
MSDPDLLKQLNIVHDRLDGNPAFPNPTIDLATFKTGIDRLTVLVSNAADGGKKVISEKNKQRQVLVKMYGKLGHYVEDASDDDPVTFNSSGFVAASTQHTPPGPLPPATMEWIDRGPLSGQVDVKPKAIPKAASYDVQYGVVVNGAPPAKWTTVTQPSSKKMTISNLTPGATYAFQIRALGRLGYTDWSDSMTFICG